MKKTIVIIPIVILAFSLNFLPSVDTKMNKEFYSLVHIILGFSSGMLCVVMFTMSYLNPFALWVLTINILIWIGYTAIHYLRNP